jgi:MFS family permease
MPRSPVFFGWWVTAAFSVMVFTSAGIRHAVGPFLKPIVADLGVDRASFSLVIALGLLLYGVFQPWTGHLVDRIGARTVTAGGTVLLALALALTAASQNLWHLTLTYGVLVALALAATGPVIASSVVSRWFDRRRGLALSILGSATMTGMSLLVPVVTWLILAVGWRHTFLVLAAAVLVLKLPLCLLVVRDSPESLGLAADGDRVPRERALPASTERTRAADAVQTVTFWQLAGSFLTCGFSMSLLSAHGIPMLTDHGYTPMFASWTFSVLGASSIVFTMFLGFVSDRCGRRPVLAGIYAGRALVFAGLFLIRDNPWAMLGVAVAGGLTMAGTMSMTSALTADIYGRFSVGSVLGLIFLVHQTGSALGSWLAGALFEATGGYGVAYAVACLLLVAAAVVSLCIDTRAPVARLGTRPAGA